MGGPRGETGFRWRADDGPLIVVFGSSVPSSTKLFIKQKVKFGPPMAKRSGSAHVTDWVILEAYVQTDESPLEFKPTMQNSLGSAVT